ncbi:MAG: hemolysin III family protein [Fusobacteria bacterium]|jgi:hemolysin III|nr:hemolysin III family protein [Fusobacteriota bacterium]
MDKKTYEFSLGEEILNAITHGIGALLAIAALVVGIVLASIKGTAWHVVSFAIYGTSFFIMYINSTMYHALTHKKAKKVFEIFDHGSIYIFIAGTYTPYSLTVLRDSKGWIIFYTVWIIAIIGIIFKVFFVKRFVILSTLIYIIMGWIIVIDFAHLKANLHPHGLYLLVAGGIFYTIGTIFYVIKKIRYFHGVWHFFVLFGSITHFFSVLYLLKK